jgi:hypothetical protein
MIKLIDLLKEISPTTFKSALNVSKERGTDRRTYKLGQQYFNQFIGRELMGGKITDIGVSAPQQANYRNISITIEYTYPNAEVVPDSLRYDYIYYDIDKDLYDIDKEIDRKDAVVLSKIAQHINPDTRYKQTGMYFNIKY